MISFKDAQFPKEVILFAVFFYVRYAMLNFFKLLISAFAHFF